MEMCLHIKVDTEIQNYLLKSANIINITNNTVINII